MPATYTHGVYGEKVLEALDEKTQELIQKHRGLYDIGLSGPDILFFFRPFGSHPVQMIGYDLHEVPARDFFMNAREVILKSKDSEAALVYILGFVNHFVLDSECHPLVNKTTSEMDVSHSELESEFDAMLMREKGLDPVRTSVCAHMIPKKEYAKVIAPFFEIEPKEVHESLVTLRWLLNFFVAPSEMKRKFIYAVMKKVGAYDHYQGLIFNREAREDTKEVCQQLRKGFDYAIETSVRFIDEYQRTLTTGEALDERYDRNFE